MGEKKADCTLLCEPLLLKPRREDGSIDADAEGTLSHKWYSATLCCLAGDGEHPDIWVPKQTVRDGQLAVGGLPRIRFALYQFSKGTPRCSCGSVFHRLRRVELAC